MQLKVKNVNKCLYSKQKSTDDGKSLIYSGPGEREWFTLIQIQIKKTSMNSLVIVQATDTSGLREIHGMRRKKNKAFRMKPLSLVPQITAKYINGNEDLRPGSLNGCHPISQNAVLMFQS